MQAELVIYSDNKNIGRNEGDFFLNSCHKLNKFSISLNA